MLKLSKTKPLAFIILMSAFFSLAQAQTKATAFDEVQTDYYRRMLAKGNTPEVAAAWVLSSEGKNHIAAKRYMDAYVECNGRPFFSDIKHTEATNKAIAMSKGQLKIEMYICKK